MPLIIVAVVNVWRASLEAGIDRLGTELRGFTTTVVVGLLLEYLPDFIEKAAKSGTKQAWKKHAPLAVKIMEDRAWYPHWVKPFEIVGAIMIVLGVSGELFTEFARAKLEADLRHIDNSIVAGMGEQAAEANERAGNALERAERLQNENLKLQQRLAWRRITPEQHRRFVAMLKPFKAPSFDGTRLREMETEVFSKDITAVFHDAGWWTPTREFGYTDIPTVYGLKCVVDVRTAAGDALAKVLKQLPSANITTLKRAMTLDDMYPAYTGDVASCLLGLRPPP